MRWLREHGLISNLEDYLSLPLTILYDARLLAEAETARAEAEARHRQRI